MRAALGDHHRVEHHGRLADQVERLARRPRSSRRAEHPDLHRVDPDVVGDRPHLTDDRLGRDGVTPSTATVFCHVTAVIAVIPCTPQRANALRSAWIPAPPPESDPAIESTRGMRRPDTPGSIWTGDGKAPGTRKLEGGRGGQAHRM